LGFGMPAEQMVAHSIFNIIGGCLLAYSWFYR